jgi:hypothetical protein
MLVEAVARAREAIAAVAVVTLRPGGEPGFRITGTAWCAGTPTTFVTASHVVNPRGPGDRVFLLRRPDPQAPDPEIWEVAEVPLDDPHLDVAVLRVPASRVGRPIPLLGDPVPDGSRVLTLGCPSPTVRSRSVAADGQLVRVEALVAPFANEGIVSGHYVVELGDGGREALCYEFNVSWLNGESGGVILRPEPFAAFAVMQSYRPITTPVGKVPGPRRGHALAAATAQLRALGMM